LIWEIIVLFTRWNIIASSIFLTACVGGGGGGGTSATMGAFARSQVPFYTPVRIDSINPIPGATSYVYDSSSLISQDLSGSGQESLILAGRMAPNNDIYHDYGMQIWDWDQGNLVNKTSQWFAGTDNIIIGTEPSIQFADFDNDGLIDMYVAPHTDTNVYGPGIVFFNEGGRFTRQNIDLENTNGHGSAVYDLDGDGYVDIITTGLRFTFGGANRTFTTYWGRGDYAGGGGDVAAADFLGDGTSTLILTDVGSNQADNNRLYSWSMELDGVYISQIGVLPTPRFLLDKWKDFGFAGSHDTRVLAFDFDNSGLTDAVIFSRPWLTNGEWPAYSEIQFNRNLGGGVFEDVTDSVLIGYDNTMPASYSPVLSDINNDGLIDIVLTGTGWGDNSGAQVLLHTSDHKFVASYSKVLQAFVDQSFELEQAINNTAGFGGNGVVFVRGPDNQMYLATAISYQENNVQKKAIYLSKLGNIEPTAQITADILIQAWPWMSSAEVNASLANSTINYLNGVPIIDFMSAISPIGSLGITLDGRKGQRQMINGNIRIPGLKSNLLSNVIAVDDLGRDFRVDLTVLEKPMDNLSIQYSELTSPTDAWSSKFVASQVVEKNNIHASGNAHSWTTGAVLKPFGPDSSWSMITAATQMKRNPWLNFSGMFGRINSSTILETSLVNTWSQGHWLQLGGMQTSTDFVPGLVTDVSNIYSVFAAAGWQNQEWSIYGGIQPYVVSGNINLKLPSWVDRSGILHYNKHKIDIKVPLVSFAGAVYRKEYQNRSWKITGIINSQKAGLFRIEYQQRF
jgi:hypothetical protein